jgi:hypothetical protein
MIADMSGKPLVWSLHSNSNTSTTTTSTTTSSSSDGGSSDSNSEGVLETLYQLHEDWIALEKSNGYELQQLLDEDAVEVRLQMIQVVKSIRNTPAKASGKYSYHAITAMTAVCMCYACSIISYSCVSCHSN